ncbi:cytochrome P450 [Aspergillus alliaceus]|uniref:cytochrome P450 n=1 Tax=Petromyces alliaceus TaxID=209559 RepID=UPI0012A501F2|nr:cytochrome P450 [Aspergillus alliaceus]KAB8230411.1 cytochrome P450 [Aspergillus alliaceus]
MSSLVLVVQLVVLYFTLKIIWMVYFHPLRNLPGPKMWIAFPVLRFFALSRGQLEAKMRHFHNQYGEVVRFGPNEVSFITAQAWKDIYGHGHQQLPKVLHSTSNPSDIISANNADHSRFRRSLAYAFSANGLQSQEPIIQKYADLLIEKLKIAATSTVPEVDMYHYWVSTIFLAIRGVALVQFKDAYPLLFRALSLFVTSKRLMKARQRQIEYSRATIQKRLRNGVQRECADFIDSVLRHPALLSGITYWLLRTPHAMRNLAQEIRSTLKTKHDITVTSTASLPYLLACLKEGLRVYPPAPSGQQRMTSPGPSHISGHLIPPNLANAKDDESSPFYNDNRDVLQPFSTGARNCIGRELAYSELRVILARVLWTFDLELLEDSKNWDLQRSYLVWEKPPLMCRLKLSDKEGSGITNEG